MNPEYHIKHLHHQYPFSHLLLKHVTINAPKFWLFDIQQKVL